MKFLAPAHVVLLLPLLALAPCGCDRQDSPPETKAVATPAPAVTPARENLADNVSDKLKDKANKALASLGGFLNREDPRLQAKLQKLGSKIARNKDSLRKKLQEERDALQPQIDQLKERVAQAEGKSKEDVDRQLSDLQAQGKDLELKATEIEGASGDVFKKLRAQLKDDEGKKDGKRNDADMPPLPSATPSATP